MKPSKVKDKTEINMNIMRNIQLAQMKSNSSEINIPNYDLPIPISSSVSTVSAFTYYKYNKQRSKTSEEEKPRYRTRHLVYHNYGMDDVSVSMEIDEDETISITEENNDKTEEENHENRIKEIERKEWRQRDTTITFIMKYKLKQIHPIIDKKHIEEWSEEIIEMMMMYGSEIEEWEEMRCTRILQKINIKRIIKEIIEDYSMNTMILQIRFIDKVREIINAIRKGEINKKEKEIEKLEKREKMEQH